MRNLLPIFSTLDLYRQLRERAEDESGDGEALGFESGSRLVLISNSGNLTRNDPAWHRWPKFSDGAASRPEFRSRLNGADIPAATYAARLTELLPGDGRDMGRELLERTKIRQHVIEPTVGVLSLSQVDPSLIRIWTAYGYMRAADVLGPGGDLRGALFWSSDWITAARRQIWLTEDVGGGVGLGLDRCLYLAIRSLERRRDRARAASVPPRSDRLRQLVPELDEAKAVLRLNGTEWMPRDPLTANRLGSGDFDSIEQALDSPATTQADLAALAIDRPGVTPFADLGGTWPTGRIAAEAAQTLFKGVDIGGNRIPFRDPNTLENTSIPINADKIREAVAHRYRLPAQREPSTPFPIWLTATGFGSGDSVRVAGIDPFANKIILFLHGGSDDAATGLPRISRRDFEGPADDPVVGVLDAIAVPHRTPNSGGPNLMVVRGQSGRYWIRRGVVWQPVANLRRVEAGLADQPCEGHVALPVSDGVLIVSQSNRGEPIAIRAGFDRVTRQWRTHELEWPEWPGLGPISRSVVGSRLPAIERTDGRFGSLVHAADGHIWHRSFEPSEPDLTLVSAEPLAFPLTGSSDRLDAAALAGLDGDVLRRFRVVLADGPDGPAHRIEELPPFDLREINLPVRHYGRALATDAAEPVAVVPVELFDGGRHGLVRVSGLEANPVPEISVFDASDLE